jgi:hypothetical protein
LPPSPHSRYWYAGILIVCAAALVLAAYISSYVVEGIPHVEDEVAYIFQAKALALGRFSVPTPPIPDPFWTSFVLDYHGQRFGKYTFGWPLLLSLGVILNQLWLPNALLGALGLLLTFLIGRDLYEARTGLLAAALGLTCAGFLAESSLFFSHPASMVFGALAVWRAIHLGKTNKTRDALIVGLAMGYVFLIRPFAAAGLGLPLALFLIHMHYAGHKPDLRNLLILAAAAIGLSSLLFWQWAVETGSPFLNPYAILWPYDTPGFGPDHGVGGYTTVNMINNLKYNLETLGLNLFGYPGYLNLLPLSLALIFDRRQLWNYRFLFIFLSLVAVYAFYWNYGGHNAGFPRYYFDALPYLLLLSARGITLAVDWLKANYARWWWAPYGLLIGLTIYAALYRLPPALLTLKDKYGIDSRPLQVVQKAGLTHALVFIEGFDSWHDFAVPFAANSPLLNGNIVYAIDFGPGYSQPLRRLYHDRDCYLLTQGELQTCPPLSVQP